MPGVPGVPEPPPGGMRGEQAPCRPSSRLVPWKAAWPNIRSASGSKQLLPQHEIQRDTGDKQAEGENSGVPEGESLPKTPEEGGAWLSRTGDAGGGHGER